MSTPGDSLPDLEMEFLLACLAHELNPTRPWPQPPAGLDWMRLDTLLSVHRLAGHFHALSKTQSESWPAEFRERLRGRRYRWMAYGEKSRSRVGQVLAALKAAEIPVIVLKGWAFISTLYRDDVSQRLCEDVDLLIRPETRDAAESVLCSIGCVPALSSWPGYDRRYHNGRVYLFSRHPAAVGDWFSVGLHWGLFHIPSYDPKRVDVDELFERALPLNVAGEPVLQLSGADDLIYTCAHLGLHHRYDDALFRYFEIASLVQNAGLSLDWDVVAQRVSGWQLILPVREVIGRVRKLWPEVVPIPASEALDRLIPNRWERFVDAWMRWTRGNPALNHLLVWLTFPDWKQRPLIFLQDVFPGPDYLRLRYGPAPSGLWPLLYFRRFVRAFGLILGRV